MRVRECHGNDARIIVAEVDEEFAHVGDMLMDLGAYLNMEMTDKETLGSINVEYGTNLTCLTATLIS